MQQIKLFCVLIYERMCFFVKKKIIITVGIILGVFILGIGAAVLLSQYSSISISTGNVLISDNGTCFLVRENSPIRLSLRDTEKNVIPELKNGDEIFVIHDGIAESYPASTGVFWCKKIRDGNISEISPDVISSMKTLGWLSEDFDGTGENIEFRAQFVRTELPHAAPGGTLFFPMFTVLKNTGELENYCKEKQMGINDDFLNAVKSYDDAFFEDNALFIAHLEEGSGSNTHEVKKVIKSGSDINVYIDTITPDAGTCDMAYHRILLEIKRSDAGDARFNLFFNGLKAVKGMKAVEIIKDNGNFSLSLPEDWRYEEINAPDGSTGISIYHYGSPESTVTIEFMKGFGVCGTGLTTKETRINGYAAHMGIYDSNPTFDYIVFEDTPGFYVIRNNADATWWQTYGEDMRAILSTLRIADGILFREEALAIAQKNAIGENKRQYGEFDTDTGIWSFTFETDEKSQIVKVDKNGKTV